MMNGYRMTSQELYESRGYKTSIWCEIWPYVIGAVIGVLLVIAILFSIKANIEKVDYNKPLPSIEMAILKSEGNT